MANEEVVQENSVSVIFSNVLIEIVINEKWWVLSSVWKANLEIVSYFTFSGLICDI